MENIRLQAVAGVFYEKEQNALTNTIEQFKQNSIVNYEYKTRAVIVPHAGYAYSGQLAYDGLKCLEDCQNIIIFAPAHKVAFSGLALSGANYWQTPLGDIEININIVQEIEREFGAKIFNEAHREEHAIEVQLPLLKTLQPNAKIIPILVGKASADLVFKIIQYFYSNPDVGFVISSDLSHFMKEKEAKEVDTITAQMIETSNILGFNSNQACGVIPIRGLTSFTSQNNYSLIRIGMTNSANAGADKSRVVGYGAWMLYEGKKNEFIKKYYSSIVKKLCKHSIQSRYPKHFPNNEILMTEIPPVLFELGASFVTLEIDRNLKGCIGSVIAHRPLYEDLIANAQHAAFEDPRFEPVKENEIDKLEISISLLSIPEKMEFKDESDLLSKITPFVDGIIIKDGYHQAVYLPSVWEQIPNKVEFLNSLKLKAGLSAEHFSKTFEVYKFYSEYITDL